jgi:hypothetical protein
MFLILEQSLNASFSLVIKACWPTMNTRHSRSRSVSVTSIHVTTIHHAGGAASLDRWQFRTCDTSRQLRVRGRHVLQAALRSISYGIQERRTPPKHAFALHMCPGFASWMNGRLH